MTTATLVYTCCVQRNGEWSSAKYDDQIQKCLQWYSVFCTALSLQVSSQSINFFRKLFTPVPYYCIGYCLVLTEAQISE